MLALEPAAPPHTLSNLKYQVGDDVALRILPISDASTEGSKTLPDGYGTALTELFEKNGNRVEFVDAAVEGVESQESSSGGETIDQIISKTETSVPQAHPNVVILNTGTADCQDGANGNKVGDKMTNLLDAALERPGRRAHHLRPPQGH